MERTSKDLLHLEHQKSPASSLESTLFVCGGKSASTEQTRKSTGPSDKQATAPIPKSEVLGKVQNFLGVISEANKKLQEEAKNNSSEDLDIEVLTGNESQYIEMDLMLGVTDLHTPEAVAAAEFAISGYQPVITLADSSDGDGSSDEESDDISDKDSDVEDTVANPTKENSERKNCKSRKRPRILELP